jgi:hypothetical protein
MALALGLLVPASFLLVSDSALFRVAVLCLHEDLSIDLHAVAVLVGEVAGRKSGVGH